MELRIYVEDTSTRICWRIGYGKWEIKKEPKKIPKHCLGQLAGHLLRKNCCERWRRVLVVGSPCEGQTPGANIHKKEVETIC